MDHYFGPFRNNPDNSGMDQIVTLPPDESAGSFHEVLISGIELKVRWKYPNSTVRECRFRYTAFTGAACRPFQVSFQPRDAMLARYMLSPCVCLSVCHRPVCIETTARIELGFGTEASFDLSHLAG